MGNCKSSWKMLSPINLNVWIKIAMLYLPKRRCSLKKAQVWGQEGLLTSNWPEKCLVFSQRAYFGKPFIWYRIWQEKAEVFTFEKEPWSHWQHSINGYTYSSYILKYSTVGCHQFKLHYFKLKIISLEFCSVVIYYQLF